MLTYDSIQETRKFIFNNMDGGILIKFGEMMSYLAVFIFDTGKHFLDESFDVYLRVSNKHFLDENFDFGGR